MLLGNILVVFLKELLNCSSQVDLDLLAGRAAPANEVEKKRIWCSGNIQPSHG